MTNPNPNELNESAHQQWETKAAFWDDMHGDEGNIFHRTLVAPTAERLLKLQPGETVLDLACGNGVFSRQMAELGATVVACDFSTALIDHARQRRYADRIDYRVVDATDSDALRTLGLHRFDAVVCNMALMDIATLDPLLIALRDLLKPGGRAVFTLMHPCFNHTAVTLLSEQFEEGGAWKHLYALKITDYLGLGMQYAIGAKGEPGGHYVFHRSLGELFSTCFVHGWVMDGLEEAAFPPPEDAGSPILFAHYHRFPMLLGFRLKRAGVG